MSSTVPGVVEIGEPNPSTMEIVNIAQAFGFVFAARMGAAATAFAGTVLIARDLGPAGFGRFTILLAIMTVIAGLTGPALDASLVRFAARNLGRDGPNPFPFFRCVFRIKLWVALALLTVGVAAARPVMDLLLSGTSGEPVPAYACTIAFWGAAAITLWGFSQAYFQANQLFSQYAFLEFFYAALRLALVLGVFLASWAGVVAFLLAYALAPALLTAVAWTRLPGKVFFSRERVSGVGRQLYDFAKWAVAASMFTTAAQRADVLMLAYCQTPEASLGHYGAAVNLALLGDLAVMTLFTVLLPRVSQIDSPARMRAFLQRSAFPVAALSVLLSPLVLCGGFVARVTFGPEFGATGSLFAVLLLGTLFSMGCAPAGTAVYGMGRPGIVALLEGAKLAGIVAVGFVVIPRFGIMGMAWTVAAVKGTIGIVTYVVAGVAARQMQGPQGT